MGVLQRFERRLEGLVEGAFARMFGGVVQPVEVAAALQREAADKKQILGPGKVLVPNAFVVEVGTTDLERFGEWDAQLRNELAAMVTEHAQEQGWSFVGGVDVSFEQVDRLSTGVFQVRSAVVPDPVSPAGHLMPAARSVTSRPRLVLAGVAGAAERIVPLTLPVTVIGRGTEADVRLPDSGVSRRHAALHLTHGAVRVFDMGSTNGTNVNGQPVRESDLYDGDRLDIGATALMFRSDGS